MVKFNPYHKEKIENIHDFNTKVNRGVGVIKPKKGKGSFKRKNKHSKRYV